MKRVKKRLSNAPWKRIAISAAVVLPLAMIAVQLAYPQNRTVLFAQVDGIEVGGVERSEAERRVQATYKTLPLEVYFGEADDAYHSPSLEELGVDVNSQASIDKVMYNWWLRVVPSSLWWAHLASSGQESQAALGEEAVRSYVLEELGESCRVAPKNAGIKASKDRLALLPAENGGECEVEDVIALISDVTPSPLARNSVRIPLEKIEPTVSNEEAEALISEIETRLEKPIELSYGNLQIELTAQEIRSWLEFEVKDDQLVPSVSVEKAKDTIVEKLQSRVAKTPGIVTITTKDFQVISRTGGGTGQALNVAGTVANITNFIRGGSEEITVAVTVLQPQERYIRSYSSTDTGLSALIQHYAQDRPGTYGVSLIELSGKGRRAGYNQQRNFFPASTYKVYLAYSALKQVESGKMRWNDQIVGGRTLAQCFDDMITVSDNPCPEALTLKIGVGVINSDLSDLGLRGSRFIGPGRHRATAEDLSNFMANLQAGQLPINSANRDRLISALQRNIFRQGIPAGTSGSVANKVGFIDGLLHDTAIVSASSGTYVLTILTEGSSWARIAELTREIEKLRAQ